MVSFRKVEIGASTRGEPDREVTGMNEKQRVMVEFIKKGRPEIKFDIEEKDHKLTIIGQGQLPWPPIIIGRNGGVTIGVRSYDTSKKPAEQWALEADQLLLKQTARDSKKDRRFAPLLENFNFFAFAYLNDWWQYDRHFVAGLSLSNSGNVRLYWINEAASYYQIGRRFPKKKDGGERLGKALDRLDVVLQQAGTLTEQNVDEVVTTLAEKFNADYENGIEISAASKFMWIRNKTPVVIFDSRASACLPRLGATLDSSYAKYRCEWLRCFEQREETIRAACNDLLELKKYAPDAEMQKNVTAIVTSRWFYERVFDKFLWWNGRSQQAPE